MKLRFMEKLKNTPGIDIIGHLDNYDDIVLRIKPSKISDCSKEVKEISYRFVKNLEKKLEVKLR